MTLYIINQAWHFRIIPFWSLGRYQKVYRIKNAMSSPPPILLQALVFVYGLRELSSRQKKQRIWTWARNTAWRKVKTVMNDAGLEDVKATPKGLRHRFGIVCNQKEIQLNMAQKWLGHANIKTAAIYSNAVGQEERNVARRLWE